MTCILPITDHEFKKLIPPLSEEERTQLEQNILLKRKCYDAITLWNGIIIDGHNRFEICTEHGIEFEIKEMTFSCREEAKLWILENQLARRNVPPAMRVKMVLLKEEILQEKAKKNQCHGGRPKESDEKGLVKRTEPFVDMLHVRKALAAEANVSDRALYMCKEVMKNGTPELQEHLVSGKIKIGTAYRLLPKQMLKELGLAGKMHKAIAENISHVTDKGAREQLLRGLDGLASLLQDLTNKKEGQGNATVKN